MTDQHPITPPPELVTSLRDSAPYGLWETNAPRERWLINCAYAAGADQEMEACVNWLADPCAADMPSLASDLRYSRRPNPPSLKEQALKGFDDMSQFVLGELEGTSDYGEYKKIADTVREALESL